MSVKLILPIPGLQMSIKDEVGSEISDDVNEDNAKLSAENKNLMVRGKPTIS